MKLALGTPECQVEPMSVLTPPATDGNGFSSTSVAGIVQTEHNANAYRLFVWPPGQPQSADLEDLTSWPS